MRQSEAGFTVLEWCVLVVAVAVMAACAMPVTVAAKQQANVVMDQMQMRQHYTWLEAYRRMHRGGLPNVGGHKFVMSTWVARIFDHTPENLDAFFTPGARESDPDFRAQRSLLERGEDPWPELAATTSTDTHYVGRGEQFLRTARRNASQPLMATDNEGRWVFADGSLNILFNGGNVRSYSYKDLEQRFGLGPMTEHPVRTWGRNSPIPECQYLDN